MRYVINAIDKPFMKVLIVKSVLVIVFVAKP